MSKFCVKSDKLKQFDIFGRQISFNYSDQSSVYNSWAGLVATCLVLIIAMLATIQNIIIM